MLDELLGRAELKSRIADLQDRVEELEGEKEDLRAQLDAEGERRREAERARQEAERRVNRLEDRVAGLEGQLEADDDGAGTGTDRRPSFRGTESLYGDRTAAVLDRLASFDAGPEGTLTAAVGAEEPVPDALAESLGERSALVRRAAPCVAVTGDAGLVAAALAPPVQPDPFVEWGRSFRLERSWFLPEGEHALALVRSDLFAIGEYEGRERLSVRSFESEVGENHSKGGFSQARFERRRDEAVADHLRRCRAAIEERSAERLYVVGDRAAVAELGDEAAATATVDASGDPEAALDRAARSFWTTRLSLL